MTQPLAIEAKDLTKRFGKFTALDGLNLRIESGTVHGLLDPNGAGKTTAIKILCGLLKPSRGEARIFGEKLPDRSILHQLGYMPQETALYRNLSVHQNLVFYGNVYGMSKDRIANGVRWAGVLSWAWRGHDGLPTDLGRGQGGNTMGRASRAGARNPWYPIVLQTQSFGAFFDGSGRVWLLPPSLTNRGVANAMGARESGMMTTVMSVEVPGLA